jgi:hypothetical protein
VIPFDTLPDEALLVIFDHYVCNIRFKEESQKVEKAWQSLAHVCRRWRCIVFESPRRLDLRLVCTGRTPARDRLDVWPTLPLIIQCDGNKDPIRSVDNIIAALERTDRVCRIDLGNVWTSNMEIFLAAMQQPFPELTNLFLWPNDETVPVIPDSFLGGSAPRLEHLLLSSIPFPGLPKLLLSATHLVTLHLYSIPHSGYFTPDTIATAFSMLTSLDHLRLEFISTRSCPDRASRRPPPSTRSVLPVLTKFWFKGVSKYLEELVARIDAPQLNYLTITVFDDIIFDTTQLIQFIRRTPNLKAFEKADIELRDYAAMVKFSLQASPSRDEGYLSLGILCKGLDRQLLYLRRVCTSFMPPLSTLEDLYVSKDPGSQLDWQDNIDNEPWLELLRPFSAVKNLYLAGKSASRVASVLQELVEGRTLEVLPMILPTLQNIFVKGLRSSGSVQEGIGQFVAARQLAGHPIAVSRWK